MFAHDGLLETIIATGDVLDGLVVASLSVFNNYLGNDGQIAFMVKFESGLDAIYLATGAELSEVPLPAGWLLFLSGAGAVALRR